MHRLYESVCPHGRGGDAGGGGSSGWRSAGRRERACSSTKMQRAEERRWDSSDGGSGELSGRPGEAVASPAPPETLDDASGRRRHLRHGPRRHAVRLRFAALFRSGARSDNRVGRCPISCRAGRNAASCLAGVGETRSGLSLPGAQLPCRVPAKTDRTSTCVNAGVLLTHFRRLRIDPPPGGSYQQRRQTLRGAGPS